MDTSGSKRSTLFEIYTDYYNIVSKKEGRGAKEELTKVSNTLEARCFTCDALFNDLSKLCVQLELSANSQQFTCFYGFVFFVCRESGQKNITVAKAIHAWKLVLAGRFRLLNQWCNFVEKHQRHNISEDTWQQLLAFSRCVNEDLEGYDPRAGGAALGMEFLKDGAWPVLIDDFVDYMYRIGRSNKCSNGDVCCGDMEMQPSISNTLQGLKLFPGSKRKSSPNIERQACYHLEKSTCCSFVISKRMRQMPELDTTLYAPENYHADRNAQNSYICLGNSACALEDGSPCKGFEGNVPTGGCFQYGNKSKVYNTHLK